MSSPIDNRGRLVDFTPLPGDPTYEQQHGSAKAKRWGNRALLALLADNNRNPLLYGQKARDSLNLLSISDLGRECPISIQIRFAQLIPGTGAAALPFQDIAPSIGDVFATAPVHLVFKVRRGVDPFAPVTEDTYRLPADPHAIIGAQNFPDMVPFDIITARSLGIDVSIEQPGASIAEQQQANVWIEAIATIVDDISPRSKIRGWTNTLTAKFIAASATTVDLFYRRMATTQFILVNTSTNANAYVAFNAQAAVTPPFATIVLPKNQFARYESPVGGFMGYATAIWDDAVPNGGMFVTVGTR